MDPAYLSLIESNEKTRPELYQRKKEFVSWCNSNKEANDIRELRQVVKARTPEPVEVVFKDLTVRVPMAESGLPSVVESLAKPFQKLGRLVTCKSDPNPGPKLFRKLDSISGSARLGEMVLVLAPPASGCSSLLKVLSGAKQNKVFIEGDLTFNGVSHEEAIFKSSVMQEDDVHLPPLTVEKTLRIPSEMTVPNNIDNRSTVVDDEIQTMMRLLGIDHRSDTLIGSSLLRGVSGGEKKRVSIGEAILNHGQLSVFDGWSRGLDAATALHIGKILRALCNISQVPCVHSLYQAGSDLFSLYDKVLLVADGKQLFFGEPDEAVRYMSSRHIERPITKSIPDFLTTLKPVSGVNLFNEWRQSSELSLLSVSLDQQMTDGLKNRGQFGISFTSSSELTPTSFIHNLYWLLWRELHLTKNNARQYIGARLGRYLFQGTILGLLFFQVKLDLNGAYNREGLLYNGITTMGTGTMALMPDILEQRAVFSRQKDCSMFKPFAWPLAKGIWDIPLALAEAIVFVSIVYWAAGLDPVFNHYIICIFLFFVFNISMSNFVRLFVYLSPDAHAAQGLCGTSVILFSFYSGFAIASNKIPVWWKWIYDISPYAYMYRALLINEYNDRTFYCNPNEPNVVPCETGQIPGREYIASQLDVDYSNGMIWWCALYLACFGVASLLLSAVAASKLNFTPTGNVLRQKHHHTTSTQSATSESDDEDHDENQHLINVTNSKSKSKPVTLAWDDISYTVPIDNGKSTKQLLYNVSGQCRPGNIVALMGATGAGKTTLLDVLARRKTQGSVEGKVTMNDIEVSDEVFRSVTGYVEQEDLHHPRSTVREAVRFSSRLRSTETSIEGDDRIADEVIELLGLGPLADTLIGNEQTGGGISLEARKRVTIAVELVSDPSVLFMDEPTSGLDSAGALVVMESARNIANSGKTVICTIHQPSEELFYMFDSLLLLHEGYVSYCGPVGNKAVDVMNYFGETATLEEGSNPAEIVMNAVKYGDIDWVEKWRQSPLLEEPNQTDFETLAGATSISDNTSITTRPAAVQFKELFKRQIMTHERTPSYNLTRLGFTIWVSVLFGSTYFQLGHSPSDLRSYVTVIFVTSNMGLLNGMTAVAPILEARPSFYRETASGTYRPMLYAISQLISEIPIVLSIALVWVNILYWMSGFPSGAYLFFTAEYLVFVCFMQFFGMAIASLVPNLLMAQVLLPVICMAWNLHSGFLILTKSIPVYLKEFNIVNPFTYFLRSMVTNVLTHTGPFMVDGIDIRQLFLDEYSWSFDTHVADVLRVLGGVIFMALVFLLGTVYKKHITR
eukprot:TRINITY_DN14015_c0_g1_i2.p1 TRINITY_DN14015_c0_g1~~TRINITY_DN14015_c0_g1_i2.p1  ORF type:complete len:1315 (+),score=313.42 TRINITY_DN14015_c0_g1_i2:41-3946(+)